MSASLPFNSTTFPPASFTNRYAAATSQGCEPTDIKASKKNQKKHRQFARQLFQTV